MTAGTRLTCQTCHEKFTRPLGTSRLNCYKCRPDRSKVVSANFGQNLPNSDENGQIEGNVTRLSRITLEKAGIFETWQAAAVMALAQHIDEGKGGGSAGVAGAIRAHAEAMDRALAISEADEGDEVDNIFQGNFGRE